MRTDNSVKNNFATKSDQRFSPSSPNFPSQQFHSWRGPPQKQYSSEPHSLNYSQQLLPPIRNTYDPIPYNQVPEHSFNVAPSIRSNVEFQKRQHVFDSGSLRESETRINANSPWNRVREKLPTSKMNAQSHPEPSQMKDINYENKRTENISGQEWEVRRPVDSRMFENFRRQSVVNTLENQNVIIPSSDGRHQYPPIDNINTPANHNENDKKLSRRNSLVNVQHDLTRRPSVTNVPPEFNMVGVNEQKLGSTPENINQMRRPSVKTILPEYQGNMARITEENTGLQSVPEYRPQDNRNNEVRNEQSYRRSSENKLQEQHLFTKSMSKQSSEERLQEPVRQDSRRFSSGPLNMNESPNVARQSDRRDLEREFSPNPDVIRNRKWIIEQSGGSITETDQSLRDNITGVYDTKKQRDSATVEKLREDTPEVYDTRQRSSPITDKSDQLSLKKTPEGYKVRQPNGLSVNENYRMFPGNIYEAGNRNNSGVSENIPSTNERDYKFSENLPRTYEMRLRSTNENVATPQVEMGKC